MGGRYNRLVSTTTHRGFGDEVGGKNGTADYADYTDYTDFLGLVVSVLTGRNR